MPRPLSGSLAQRRLAELRKFQSRADLEISRARSSGCLIILLQIGRLNLEHQRPAGLRSVVALDRNPDGDGAGQQLGNISLGGTRRLGSRRLPVSRRVLWSLISTHGPDLAIFASVRGRGWCKEGHEGGVSVSGRGGFLATIPIPEHREEPRKAGGSWSGPDVGLGARWGGSSRRRVSPRYRQPSRPRLASAATRISTRTSPRGESRRLPLDFARTHSSAAGPPRIPRRSSSNSTTPPSLRDGLMATPSAAQTRSPCPFPHNRAVLDSFSCCFQSASDGTPSDDFDWSDGLPTGRIPTLGKVPSIAGFQGRRLTHDQRGSGQTVHDGTLAGGS